MLCGFCESSVCEATRRLDARAFDIASRIGCIVDRGFLFKSPTSKNLPNEHAGCSSVPRACCVPTKSYLLFGFSMKRRTLLAAGLTLPFTLAGFDGRLSDMNTSSAHTWTMNNRSEFLRDMQRRNYQFFLEAVHPTTGFVADRAATDGSTTSTYASSAACGFALASHCVAADNGWGDRQEIAQRVKQLLSSLLNQAAHQHGFVYHFFDAADGSRAPQSEASSIDTALMIAGAMTAAVAFADQPEIVQMADHLYRRVDWKWMLGDNNCLHMGWTPEEGIIPYQWDSFSELVILVLLAIGAPENAIDGSCWQAWRREPVLRDSDGEFLSYPPLFVHQYPMAFFDFRNLRSPSGRSYWDNSTRGHLAQIDFLTELGRRYPDQFDHYGSDFWGITSSDSEAGYRDWGGPYEDGRFEPDRGIDGTLVPSAAAGGLAIVPHQATHTLLQQYTQFGDKIYGRYGFTNAYNPVTGWVGRDVIGIDTGISLLMAENSLSGGVWKHFMQHPAASRALRKAGFTEQRDFLAN